MFHNYIISKIFRSDTPGTLQKLPRCLDPDTNFRLARQRSHCSCFTKRPLYIFQPHSEKLKQRRISRIIKMTLTSNEVQACAVWFIRLDFKA